MLQIRPLHNIDSVCFFTRLRFTCFCAFAHELLFVTSSSVGGNVNRSVVHKTIGKESSMHPWLWLASTHVAVLVPNHLPLLMYIILPVISSAAAISATALFLQSLS